MKRMMVLLLALVLMNGGAWAEGESAQQAELTEKALERFCEMTDFPAEDIDDLSVRCELQDSPLSDPEISDQQWAVIRAMRRTFECRNGFYAHAGRHVRPSGIFC